MPYTRRDSQRVGVRVTAQARQRPQVRWTSKNTRRSPSAMRRPVDAAHVAAHLVGDADRHVARDDRIRHARQPAVPDVHVGAADLGIQRAQEHRTRLERRLRELAQLDRHRGAGMTAATIDDKGVRIPHASFRIRMPRLRSSLRVPDAREPVARVPGVPGRGAPEALSVFAAQSSTPAKSFGGWDRPISACGSCGDPRGPGSCSMN